SWSSTSPYGNVETPFNLCHLVYSAGASYVARWTSLNVRRLQESIEEALLRPGFSFIEVVSACPTTFGRRNEFDTGLKMLRYFNEKTVIKHNIDPKEVPIVLGQDIVVGKFINKPIQPTLEDRVERVHQKSSPK
ncbi:2-oxoacid:ferredoxin oxidoreductase subunit beta, partial [Candidatus Heimdallarchaeota archaeon]